MAEEKPRRATESEEARYRVIEREMAEQNKDTQLIEARIEATKETLLEVGRKMKALGYEIRAIAKVTGLSEEEIDKL